MSAKTPRFGVVGAGIVGLAVARRLTELGYPVTVLEKERHVAAHQTGHNSGVVHAGLYYQPGSLKARLCRRGMTLLEEYCDKRSLPYQACGKLVVARDETELAGLDEIERRSRLNQVPGLRRVSGGELTEIEPHARGVAGLHSPRTAIVDYVAIAEAYAEDVRSAGGEIVFGAEVTGMRGARVGTTAGDFGFDRVVVCAGLHSDRVAKLAGDQSGPAIIPFRGEYYVLRPERADLVRGLIYPVPDPRYPFLGVHLTRRVDGSVEVGPNAVLALAREGYSWGEISPGDLAQTLLWSGFRRMARRHWRTGIRELYGSASRRAFVATAQSYVPDLQVDDVVRGGAGVRAQAVDADGTLVDDFRIHHRGPVTAVRNAPSPAATSSLAIAEHVVAELMTRS